MTVLKTKKLIIRPFKKAYISKKYISWLNNKEITQYSEQRHLTHNYKNCLEYYEFLKEKKHPFYAIFINEDKEKHIGNMVAYIDHNNLTANITILIGESNYWGSGYGLEAWNIFIRYLFEKYKLRKVWAGTVRDNKGMLRIMKRSGMIKDGLRKKERYINNKEMDIIYAAKYL
tara:strand:- start:368 stop:886 length:519 start_codon:yes stop_codon:yes gene_type:complete